jgi:EmrB/QacA subfamily drug resistance transporter
VTWIVTVSCDAAMAQARAGGKAARGGLVLAATILASSLAFVDGSVVTVGLPAIGRSLHGDAAELQWIVNAYLLPLSALLLLGGALGDRFGPRRVLILGVSVFAVASALCAAAPDLELLLAARALQGTGAALLMPNSLAILGNAFAGEARGRAVGTWSAASAIAGAIGPVLGGWLIDVAGWRTIFVINLPLAAAAILLALLIPRDAARSDGVPLDLRGAVLATLALAGLTFGLTLGTGAGGWSMEAVTAVASGAVLLLLFLFAEWRRGDAAMVPLALFGSAQFAGLSLLTLLLYGALNAMFVAVPFVLIRGAGWSATLAGAALLPFPVIMAATARPLGALAGRSGSRLPLAIGSAIVGLGYLLFLLFDAHSGYALGLLPAILVIAFGMSGAVAPLTTAVLSSVDPRHTASASGLNSALARLGGLIATALLGGVLAAQGDTLVAAFHTAGVASAAAAFGSAAAAFLLVGRRLKR